MRTLPFNSLWWLCVCLGCFVCADTTVSDGSRESRDTPSADLARTSGQSVEEEAFPWHFSARARACSSTPPGAPSAATSGPGASTSSSCESVHSFVTESGPHACLAQLVHAAPGSAGQVLPLPDRHHQDGQPQLEDPGLHRRPHPVRAGGRRRQVQGEN